MENKVNEEDHSLSHPPGFTPEVDQFEGNNDSNSVNNNVEPTDLDRSKLLRSGGSILNFIEEVVKETKMGQRTFEKVHEHHVGGNHIQNVQSDSVEGFDKMTEESWEAAPAIKIKAIRNFYDDVFGAVEYFFINGDIPKGCNSNFIALIPKIMMQTWLKNFTDKSIGSLYKIIAKLLANRLVGVLSNLINEVQSAFVADRQILDGPFILNEYDYGCELWKMRRLKYAANKLGCPLFLRPLHLLLGYESRENSIENSLKSVEKVLSRLSEMEVEKLYLLEERFTLSSPLVCAVLFSKRFVLWTKEIKALYWEDGSLDKLVLRQARTVGLQSTKRGLLMGFDYEIMYKKGSENRAVDALPRLPTSAQLLQIAFSTITSDNMQLLTTSCRGDKPKAWPKWVSLADYWYNTNHHTPTNVTPYELLYGQPPPNPIAYVQGQSLVD
ncbi:RNA-directed DNA polymerase, eukaryota [Tanacetum coccineum]